MTAELRTPRVLALGQLTFLLPMSVASAMVLAIVMIQPYSVGGGLALTLGFSAAFFAARLLTIRLPQGDEVCTTLMVGLVGLMRLSAPLLVVASLGAGVVDAIARSRQSSEIQTRARILDTIRGSALLGLLAPWQLAFRALVATTTDDTIIVWALLAGVTYAALDVVTAGIQQSLANDLPLTQAVTALVRPLAMVYVVHTAMAAVVLRLDVIQGAWPFPVAVLLTLILQNSFNLYLRIRRAYAETIGALAHAAELDRPHDSGHARRVSDLSVAVGRHIGISSKELEKVGYAALLHDIGRMGAIGDDRGGEHMRRGGEIAQSIPFLADVAPLILWTPDDETSDPPVGWSIVRTCSKYDRLRCEVGGPRALEAVLQDACPDSRVLESLEAVVSASLRGAGVSK